jgi:hypothetical protein
MLGNRVTLPEILYHIEERVRLALLQYQRGAGGGPTQGGLPTSHSALTGVTAGQHHAEDHDHDGAPTQQLAQANTHQSPDTDSGPTALHHTLGTGANQAAAGNHSHGITGHTIQDEGSSLTLRAKLNFVGNGVQATDDSGNDASKVTIPLWSPLTNGDPGGPELVWDPATGDVIMVAT